VEGDDGREVRRELRQLVSVLLFES
jgi:hypothetical protein